MKQESSPAEIWRFECRVGMPGHFTVWAEFCKALNLFVCGVMEQAKTRNDGRPEGRRYEGKGVGFNAIIF
jgi:hypothetical protein